MRNDNKQKVIDAIWDNPERLFGVSFQVRGNDKYNVTTDGGIYDRRERLTLSLWKTRSGENTIYAHYHDGSKSQPIFEYLWERHNYTPDFWDTLRDLANLYGIELEYTPEEKHAMEMQAFIEESAAVLVTELTANNAEAAKVLAFLEGRGFEPDGRHFGALTSHSVKKVKDTLKAKYPGESDASISEKMKEMGISDDRVSKHYNFVIPSYRNGKLRGFIFRSMDPGANKNDRYRFSEHLQRGGYCEQLKPGRRAVLAEGELKALALMKAGFENVVALGNGSLNAGVSDLLQKMYIPSVLYVPDIEFDDNNRQKTNLIEGMLKSLAELKADEERVITSVSVAELPAEEPILEGQKKAKVDADGFMVKIVKEKTDAGTGRAEAIKEACDALAAVINEATLPAWKYQLTKIVAGGTSDIADTRKKVKEVIRQTGEAFEVEEMKQYADTVPELRAAGVTSTSIDREYTKVLESEKDKEAARQKEADRKTYEARKADILKRMRAAEEGGAGPAEFAQLAAELGSLNLIRDEGARKEWNKQLSRDAAEALKMIAERPEGIKTKWRLGKVDKKTKEFKTFTNIEYTPANVEVFCAPTSHGKTMFLIQSALDFITGGRRPEKADGRTVLYISIEQTESQLLERALNVYIDIPTTSNGYIFNPKTQQNEVCFRVDHRMEAIRAAIKGKSECYGYANETGLPYDFPALSAKIMAQVDKYMTEVFPRLKIVNTNASAETIAGNIQYFVSRLAEEGQEVGLILVDYIQLMTSDIPGRSSRTEELKAICKALHSCAEAVDLPVVVAAQLNRDAIKAGIDSVSTANLGESADIERISHNLYFVWQVDRTPEGVYLEYSKDQGKGKKSSEGGEEVKAKYSWKYKRTQGGAIVAGPRAQRLYYTQKYQFKADDGSTEEREVISLKEGYMYVEQLKARDGRPGGWALFPFDGDSGRIGELTKEAEKMINAKVALTGEDKEREEARAARAEAEAEAAAQAATAKAQTEAQAEEDDLPASMCEGEAGNKTADDRLNRLLGK